MLSKEEFIGIVNLQQIKHIVIYDLNNRRIGGKSGTASNNNTVQDILDYIKEFSARYPGVYKIEAKKNFNNQKDSKFVYERVSFLNETPAIQEKGVEAFVTQQDISKLRAETRAEILAEVKAEQLRILKEQQNKEAQEQFEAKSKELDTVAGKLMHIGAMLLNGLIKKNPVLNGLLNGNTNEMNHSTTTTEPQTLSAEEITTANQALNILMSYMDANTLMKFAQKVQADPNVVSTLLKFL